MNYNFPKRLWAMRVDDQVITFAFSITIHHHVPFSLGKFEYVETAEPGVVRMGT